MFCKKCGNELADGAKFCTGCGAPVETAAVEETTVLQSETPQVEYAQPAEPQPQYVQPQQVTYTDYNAGYQNYNYNQPAQPTYQNDEQANKLQGEILLNGILGLAFATSFFASFVGIIFSSIAKKKANEYINLKGQLEGRAKVGFNLAKPGFIVGIIFTVLFAIYFLALIASM